jgi:large subunit ribosomal protein L9
MKIVLQKEVEKLGVPGDVVSVADGYARNYLIPKGFAAPATKGSAKNAERLRRTHDQKVEKAVLEAREAASKLTAVPLTVTAKAGEEGKLFGSVTAADIAKELEARTGATVDRRTVHLAEPIRTVGTHEVTIRLHPEVEAAVTVEVVAE